MNIFNGKIKIECYINMDIFQDILQIDMTNKVLVSIERHSNITNEFSELCDDRSDDTLLPESTSDDTDSTELPGEDNLNQEPTGILGQGEPKQPITQKVSRRRLDTINNRQERNTTSDPFSLQEDDYVEDQGFVVSVYCNPSFDWGCNDYQNTKYLSRKQSSN